MNISKNTTNKLDTNIVNNKKEFKKWLEDSQEINIEKIVEDVKLKKCGFSSTLLNYLKGERLWKRAKFIQGRQNMQGTWTTKEKR